MRRAARNVDNYLSTASPKFFIINRYESDLVLHQYTPELEADFHTKEALNPPYAALFETHDSQILYIAADHTIDQMQK